MKTFYSTRPHFMEDTNLQLNFFTKIMRLITASYNGYQNFRSTHEMKTKYTFNI